MLHSNRIVEQASDTLDSLASEVAKILNVDSVGVDATLLELGIDSLSAVELTLACDRIYRGVDPDQLTLTKDTTLRDLHRQLVAI